MAGHRSDRGSGLISTAAGVVVFLMFLLFAVQLLFSLYATSTISAVASDAAHRAASRGAPSVEVIERDARAALGDVGRDARFEWARLDTDGDGADDTVLLRIVARPPRFIPPSIGGTIGFDRVDRTARVRIEAFRT